MQGSHSQLSQVQRKPNFVIKIYKVSTVKHRSTALGQCACLKGMSRSITMQDLRLTELSQVQRKLNFNITKSLTKSLDGVILVKGTWSRYVLEGYAKDN